MTAEDAGPAAKRARTDDAAEVADAPMPDAAPDAASEGEDFAKYTVTELMKLYYSRLFPHQDFAKWLAYGNDSKHAQADSQYFQRREFCFTLEGDIFVRYQSFKDGDELQAALVRRLPAKIDIGPVYNVDPQRRAAVAGGERAFAPVERELVFDIDMTDYDSVRTCGKEGHICHLCWPLMAVAIKILDEGLREDFGFNHLLWVFSGRRGIHCWVCDDRARQLTDEQRSSIATYFAVYKGEEKGLAKLALSYIHHPAVQRALEALNETWIETILPNQELLENEGNWEAVLAYIPDEDVRDTLRSRWQAGRVLKMADDSINVARWHDLVAEVDKAAHKEKDLKRKGALSRCKDEVVFAYTYPRLDMEVSKKMNHLLKAPFCIHPKTGKVCVPIHPERAFDFDPDTVPTVAQLLTELDSNNGKSSMDDAVEVFHEAFLDKLQLASRETLAAKARSAAAKPTLAW
ncbi:hypothetical protein WJX72_010358 [[Myrmecia] bisecta]|uniref:DNA primase n=1 Tax=[Myrmecia] bisecta TaxID=41462 RepID=A0AAW1QSP8_9CHLO